MDKTQDQKLDEVLELAQFIAEHAATGEQVLELRNEMDLLRHETKKGFDGVQAEFVKVRAEMKEGLDDVKTELGAQIRLMQQELDDIKASLKRLEKKTQEDSDAQAHEIVSLRDRVERLERQIRLLQAA